MKNRNSIFQVVAIAIFFITTHVVAQSKNDKEILTLKTKATQYFNKKQYDEALPYYVKITELQPDNNIAFLDAGICCLYSSKEKKNAIGLLKNSLRNVSNGVDQYYYLGRAYHLSGDYDKAITSYKIFLSRYVKYDDWRNDVLLNIKQAYNCILKSKKINANANVENLADSINSKLNENSYLLVSPKSQLIVNRNAQNAYENLFFGSDNTITKNNEILLSKYGSGYWKTNLWDSSIALQNNFAISAKANYLYHFANKQKDEKNTGIYLLRSKNGSIDSTFLSHILNSNYSDKDAFYSMADSSIYFSSNRPGGYGGYDIYKTKWNIADSTWSKPQNLGTIVNTPFDEVSPFLRQDAKTIYFASNSDLSMGGYDIFSVTFSKVNENSLPENLGIPINSTFNEKTFSIADDGFTSYFISDRDGGMGYNDIWASYFVVPFESLKNKPVPNLTYAFSLLPNKKAKSYITPTVNNNSNNLLALNTKKAEPKKEDKKVEPKNEDKKAEPKKEDKKVEPKKEDKKVEPKKEDKKAEPKKEDKKVEPKKEDKKAEPKKEDKNVEPKKEDKKVEPKKEDKKVEPKKEDKKVEPKKTDSKSTTLNPNETVVLKPIRIDTKSRIDKSIDEMIKLTIDILKSDPNAVVEVHAHSALVDDPKMNLYKSIEYLKEVRDKYKQAGLSSNRVLFTAFGNEFPLKQMTSSDPKIFVNNRIQLFVRNSQYNVLNADDTEIGANQKLMLYDNFLKKSENSFYSVEITTMEKTGFLNYRISNEDVYAQINRDGSISFYTGIYDGMEEAKEKLDFVRMKGFVNAKIATYKLGAIAK